MIFFGEFPALRPFQSETHEAIRQAARDGHKRILVTAPTGSGKTILALNVIKETLSKGRRAMFLCDRKTLIAQTSEVAAEVGLGNHGIIQASNPMLDLSRRFQIASAQTLMRRGWPDTDVLVIDEAHTTYKTWVDRVLSAECQSFVIGLTATPFTKGLGKIFTKVINAATMADLTEQRILVPMQIFTCHRPDMAGAEVKAGGEWTDKAAEKAEMAIIGDVLTEWQARADGRKTIIFGPTIAYCEQLAKTFNEAGIKAATFCADTPDDVRARIKAEFADGETRVLISVEALAKGFDQKDVGCVCDCRPLRKSLSTAIQMWGRGLRSSQETGKEDCILLDFSGNIVRFLEDFENFYHNGVDSLDDGEKLDREIRKDEDREVRSCPKCGHSPFARKCTKCGHESERKSLVPELPGQMSEIKIGGKLAASNNADLWAQLATYVKGGGNPATQQGRAAHLYREIVGSWPPKGWRVADAPWIEPTRPVMGKIRQKRIAYAMSRAAR